MQEKPRHSNFTFLFTKYQLFLKNLLESPFSQTVIPAMPNDFNGIAIARWHYPEHVNEEQVGHKQFATNIKEMP